jgi:OTU-like cysteine protease
MPPSKRAKELRKRLREISALELIPDAELFPEQKIKVLKKPQFLKELKDLTGEDELDSPPTPPSASSAPTALIESPSKGFLKVDYDDIDDDSGWITVSNAPKLTPKNSNASFLPKKLARVIQTKRDGSCMFQCLGYWLNRDHLQVRKKIHSFLSKSNLTIHGMSISDWVLFETDLTLDAYLKKLKEPNTWGGELELYAASEIFESDIFVWEKEPNNDLYKLKYEFSNKKSSTKDSCHLLYVDGNHYDILTLTKEAANKL